MTRRIVVYPNIRKESDVSYTVLAVERLLSHGAAVCMPLQTRSVFASDTVEYIEDEKLCNGADMIVVLGGDGTILRAAKYALASDIPLLGINLGRLGYMAELEKDELSQLDRLFNGEFRIEMRMTLCAMIETASGSHLLGHVLNDVVVDRGGYEKTVDLFLRANDKPVRVYRADGLIFATPTGSSSYSLAAGGSFVDPSLSCICLTPICPISRYACPTIFAGDTVLEVENIDDRTNTLSVTLDGEKIAELGYGDKLRIQKSETPLKMVAMKQDGFFGVLNEKIKEYELK